MECLNGDYIKTFIYDSTSYDIFISVRDECLHVSTCLL